MKLKLRELQKTKTTSNNQQRDDFLQRSASLAVQICILNGLSLIVCTMAAFFLALQRLFKVAQLWDEFAFVQHFFSQYLEFPQHAVVVLSSNIGFLVHCYYSKLYRNAVRKVFGPVLARLGKVFRLCCPTLLKTKVEPTATEIKLRSKRNAETVNVRNTENL